ncbi:MAG TPA: polysaccharide biosynthesis tyrosine autokinase, partial [Flavisolibacter sp.]|nr:polysaccharide biosynthesis tyrosine autokinase [Flavisolibacter sp.]
MQESPQSYNYQQQEESLFQEMMKKFFPYWPLFLVLLFISISGASIFLRFQVPYFNANASLLIKDGKKGTFDQSDIMQQFNAFASNKLIENEIEVIRSRTIAKDVVRNLNLYASFYKEGQLKDYSAYTQSPILLQAKFPDSIASTDKIYFTYDNQKKLVKIDEKTYELNKWYQFPFGEVMFLRSKNEIEKEDKQNRMYFSLLTVKDATSILVGSLKVSSLNKMGSIIDVIVSDEDPKRAEDILNELISVYLEASLNDKNKLAANTLRFIDERMKFVVGDLDSVEHKVENFKATNKVVDISAQGHLFLQGVSQNDHQLAMMNMTGAVLGQVESYVLSKDDKGAIVPSTLGVNDPVLLKLLDGLYEAEIKYEALRKTTAENYPTAVALADQIEKMRSNILENVRNQRRSLSASKAEVLAANNKFSTLLSSLPKKERELVDINRQQAIKNNIYTFLLQKREETALAAASTVSDIRVVDSGESNYQPIEANEKITYILAIIVAIGLGISIITLKDALNKTIVSKDEIEKLTTVPILGEIIHDKSGKSLVIGDGNRSRIAEQFRHLRTYLGYLGITNRRKKVLITSSISGEGKSFITANLGVSLALMGKRVVLVELDLRKPELSNIFNITDSSGVADFLSGKSSEESIIKSTNINANLFIVPAGPIPQNPSELLLNSKLIELLGFLERSFDYVIIDTAPIYPVTDALIVMPMCDATLYVVRHGFTPRLYVKRLDEVFKNARKINIAVIYNSLKNRGFGRH